MNERPGPSGTLGEQGSINTIAFTSSYSIKVKVKLWDSLLCGGTVCKMLKVENLV